MIDFSDLVDFSANEVQIPTKEKLLSFCEERAETLGSVFTDEHAEAMEQIFCNRRNVLITGGAGVGKTHLVRDQIIAYMEHRGYNYGVCATTGIAGSHLQGRTIHSFLGIGLGPDWNKKKFNLQDDPAPHKKPSPQDMSAETLQLYYKDTAEQIFAKRGRSAAFQGVRKRIRNLTHMIVDEVSMMPGNALLGFIDYWMRLLREKPDLPFGGVQMIFVGDPMQLPPVCNDGTRIDWPFMSWSWLDANILPIELTRIFRQSDKFFSDMLNRIREGIPFTAEDEAFLKSRVVSSEDDKMMRTMLCATNAEADKRNKAVLAAMGGPSHTLSAVFDIQPHHMPGPYDNVERITKDLLQGKPMKEHLDLRVGLPVMITINSSAAAPIPYFNGSRGIVEALPDKPGDPVVVQLSNGKSVSIAPNRYTRNQSEDPENVVVINGKAQPEFPICKQYPLLPASGITCHRAQGMSLDECMVDMRRTFAPGHVYVMLSRLRTPEGLFLACDGAKVQVDKFALRFLHLIRTGFYK